MGLARLSLSILCRLGAGLVFLIGLNLALRVAGRVLEAVV
jgi:hypothetical protein